MTLSTNKKSTTQPAGARKIPVSVSIPWQSPSAAYQRVRSPYSFLLESVNGPERIARYSLIGLDPQTIFSAKGSKIKIAEAAGDRFVDGDPFEVLREINAAYVANAPEEFCGGAAGYFAYDAGRSLENLPEIAVDDLDLPDAVFLFCTLFIVFDHVEHTATATALAADGDDRIEVMREAHARIEVLISKLRGPAPPFPRREAGSGGPAEKSGGRSKSENAAQGAGHEREAEDNAADGVFGRASSVTWESNFTKDQFCQIVERAKEYIAAGDIYQVNLSQRLTATIQSDPFEIYTVLRDLNPSPFAGYYDFGDWQLVGCSPERLVKLEDGIAETRPIAGTIRRGKNREEDRRLKARLTNDIKERAEHIMLVDLERNDLGRVSEYGSVRADELLVTESYSHVTHIVSNIVGRLRQEYDGFDLIRACFPGGTITGCPKVRAMEIIEELEPVRRGPYTGSMGYFAFNGDLDFNIIIRTLLIRDGLAHVQAGAGIVADSQPEREYRETMDKAAALLRATTVAEERASCWLT